jgi:hypothetical protein
MPIPSLHSKFVKANLPPFPSHVGEQFAFTDDISFLSKPNQIVGQHSGSCTLVRESPGNDPDIFQCEATYDLPDGQVTARGLVALPRPAGQTDAFAISGGTGKYDNLRGEVRVTKVNEAEADYEFKTQG